MLDSESDIPKPKLVTDLKCPLAENENLISSLENDLVNVEYSCPGNGGHGLGDPIRIKFT